jgi:hypothetical protein
MTNALDAVAKIWNTETKTVGPIWYNLCLSAIFSNIDEQSGDFDGFCMSSEKRKISYLPMYAKNCFQSYRVSWKKWL